MDYQDRLGDKAISSIQQLDWFVIACLLMNLTPGPDMLYVAARSSEQGIMAGIVSALGITTGSIIYVLASAFGLAAVFIYSNTLFTLVKWAGICYLLYLGIRSIITARNLEYNSRLPKVSLYKIYRQGVIVNLLNPKIALFLLSFLPQFVDKSTSNIALPVIILGAIFNVTGTTVNSVVSVFVGNIASGTNGKRNFGKLPAYFSGGVLIVLALSLFFFF